MKHEDEMKKDLAPNGGSEYYKAISDYGDYSSFIIITTAGLVDLITTVI